MASLWTYANPSRFLQATQPVAPWLLGAALAVTAAGLLWGFFGTLLQALAAEGVEILGVAYKDDPANALAFLDELGNPYAAAAQDSRGRAALDWGVYGVPETFVVDAEGRVVARMAGPVTERVLRDRLLPAMEAAR